MSKSGKSDADIVERLYLPDDDLITSFVASSFNSKLICPSGSSLMMSAIFFAGTVVSPGTSLLLLITNSSSTSKSVLLKVIFSSSALIKMLLKIGSVCFLSATAANDCSSVIICSLLILNFVSSR